jgi:hypothetical protein
MVTPPVLGCVVLEALQVQWVAIERRWGLSLSTAGSSRGCPLSSRGHGERWVAPCVTDGCSGTHGSLEPLAGACDTGCVCSSQSGFLPACGSLPVELSIRSLATLGEVLGYTPLQRQWLPPW